VKSKSNKLIELFKAKQKADAEYRKQLSADARNLESINSFPVKLGIEGFEFIKTKSGKIFLRNYQINHNAPQPRHRNS
jgi:hypothetical protein